jgi:Ca2+-binding EF-hand superfamily protein
MSLAEDIPILKQVYQEFDNNKDGQVSPYELTNVFKGMDVSGNQIVEAGELSRATKNIFN